jgi:hypothetical protein
MAQWADARETAGAFASEFARLGYSAQGLMKLFADPFYGPAHAALRRLGEPVVCEIVAEAVSASGHAPVPGRIPVTSRAA